MAPRRSRQEAGRILLGAAIRDRRVQAGLTLAELAKRADISPSYLSDVERAKRLPPLDKLDVLAAQFDLTVTQLLDGVYPWGTMTSPRSVDSVPDGRGRER